MQFVKFSCVAAYYPYTPGDTIALSSIELEFPIELLYEGIMFETNEQ